MATINALGLPVVEISQYWRNDQNHCYPFPPVNFSQCPFKQKLVYQIICQFKQTNNQDYEYKSGHKFKVNVLFVNRLSLGSVVCLIFFNYHSILTPSPHLAIIFPWLSYHVTSHGLSPLNSPTHFSPSGK